MNYFEEFRVKPEKSFRLKKIDPDFVDSNENKESALTKIVKIQKHLDELQFQLYAEHRQSLLIILQALDAGGKDGTIRHVFGPLNPQGCRAVSFKQPSAEELSHDFLWRIEQQAPRMGEIVIFNRSHYEDVLVVRVHDIVPKKVWSKRYDQINDFEKRLMSNGTHILKFFLHISMEEQLDRFEKRLNDPVRQWKISEADYSEREFWSAYETAYEDAMSKCSTKNAPWFVIPSNHKWFRNLAISSIIEETLKDMAIKMPVPSVDIDEIRRRYHQALAEEKRLS